MNKTFASLATLSFAVLAVSACSMTPRSEIATKAPGTYESTTKHTDANGTSSTVKKTTVVREDAYGNKTGTVQTKTTTDPKGLMNKSTSTTTTNVR